MSGPSRSRAQRAPLTRGRVLHAALELVERDGAGALSMRNLGDELGVEAMSIYHHVANREALVDGVGELLMADIDRPADDEDWQTACRRFAAQLRAVTLGHPEAFRLLGLRPLVSVAALTPIEGLLACLVGAGATPATALGLYRALASYARGYALAEVTGFTVDASTADARRPLRALPADAFPLLHGEVKAMSDLSPDAAFEIGLEAILAGAALDARP